MSPTVGTLGPSLRPSPLPHTPSPALCPQFPRCPPPPAHPRSPTARSAANKGEEKPRVDPKLPTKTPFVQVPEEKRMRRGVGGAHARLCPEKGINIFFQALPGKISFAGARFNFICIYIFFLQGYFGRSCCRREERGRSRRFDLFLRRQNFAGEGPSPERGAGLVSRPAPAPAPPAAVSPLPAAGLGPGRGLDFREKKKICV